jgi:hypothetical protein
MAEPDGVDGRHKAGHDGGGSPLIVIAIRAKIALDSRSFRPESDLTGRA